MNSQTRRRAIGRAINSVIVRAPFLWPVIRGPVGRFFGNLAPGWDERTGAGSAEYLAPLAAALTRVQPAPERALDIGTGTGTAALLVAREFPSARVRGVDLSDEMIRVARKRVGLDPEGRIAFKVGDASALPWPDEHFDLVTLLNMPPFSKEISRVLRPGGYVVVAASLGDQTPFYTPDDVLAKAFGRAGIDLVHADRIAAGSYGLGRKRPT